MEALIANVPIAGAVVYTVRMLLDHFSKERDKDRTQLENHLSQSISVQKDTVVVLSKLSDRLDRVI